MSKFAKSSLACLEFHCTQPLCKTTFKYHERRVHQTECKISRDKRKLAYLENQVAELNEELNETRKEMKIYREMFLKMEEKLTDLSDGVLPDLIKQPLLEPILHPVQNEVRPSEKPVSITDEDPHTKMQGLPEPQSLFNRFEEEKVSKDAA